MPPASLPAVNFVNATTFTAIRLRLILLLPWFVVMAFTRILFLVLVTVCVLRESAAQGECGTAVLQR